MLEVRSGLTLALFQVQELEHLGRHPFVLWLTSQREEDKLLSRVAGLVVCVLLVQLLLLENTADCGALLRVILGFRVQ